MANGSSPSPTDTGWFTDTNELTAFMQDRRAADTRMASSFEDAQVVVEAFATSEEAGAWPSLDRATVAERLHTLIAAPEASDACTGYRSLSQSVLNLCGPAALLTMATGRDPVSVARYATDLFDSGSGSIGGFTVTASDELRGADFASMNARGSISSQAEWMMMSAIRNATEPFWQPEWTGNSDQELAGMTRPEELAGWMRDTGIWSNVVDAGRWASNPGIPNATAIGMAEGSDVAMLIHANLIKESTVVDGDQAPRKQSWSIDQYFPNHWVVLLSEVTSQVDDDSLEFTIWTWGGRMRLRASQRTFLNNYFGTVSAAL